METKNIFLKGWQKFWTFIKNVHSGSDEGSSKRFYGGIIIMALLIILFLFSRFGGMDVGKKVFSLEMWKEVKDSWEYALLIAASLVGLGAFESGFKAWTDYKKNKSNNPPTP